MVPLDPATLLWQNPGEPPFCLSFFSHFLSFAGEESTLSTEANSLLTEDEDESKWMEKLNNELDELEKKKGIKNSDRHKHFAAKQKAGRR